MGISANDGMSRKSNASPNAASVGAKTVQAVWNTKEENNDVSTDLVKPNECSQQMKNE
jgi:hypothetical protein